jgi:hypothetical protein
MKKFMTTAEMQALDISERNEIARQMIMEPEFWSMRREHAEP